MSSAVDGLVARILEELAFPSMPPVDPERLSHLMGVSAIEYAELVEDGRLECTGGTHRILVRRGLSEARRRFTVGHELGHLLLSGETLGPVARRALPVTDQVERFCDSFAAALLLPRGWIRERYLHRAQNLSTVRHLAKQTGASMAAAAVRLGEVLDWQLSLLRWRKDKDRWRFLAGAAVPSRVHGHVGSAERTSEVLDSIGRRTSGDLRTRLPVRLSDRDVFVEAQVSIKGKTALALADLASRILEA